MSNTNFGSNKEKNWFVRSSKVVSENPWFRLLFSKVRMPNGRDTDYHTIDFTKQGVGVVPRKENKILLIRQYRFIIDQFVWAIPSGAVEKGEDKKAAAGRELMEETGYEAKKMTHLVQYFPSYGCGNQEFTIFLGEEIIECPQAFDANEVLEVKWFPQDEVKRMAFEGKIVDGLSLTPLLLLFARETK